MEINSPKTECNYLHGGVIENGCTRNPLTLRTAPMLILVRVWVQILGDPQSVQLSTATTTTWCYMWFTKQFKALTLTQTIASYKRLKKIPYSTPVTSARNV